MRLPLVVLASLAAPSLAAAKPLPPDLKVAVVKGKVVVTRGGVSVPLFDSRFATTKLLSAELSEDGKQLAIKRIECDGANGDGSEAELYPLTEVEARLENTLGMQLHLKKKYADAITHFAIAAKDDPATPVYATNLLSALSMGGKLGDADQTIASYAKQNVAWFAWRLEVDSDLKALRGRPSTKLNAGKRGTAKGRLADTIAYSPLGLVASEVTIDMWDGIPDGSAKYELEIVDVATGKMLLRLPTETTCAVDMEAAMGGNEHPPFADKACPKREAAKAAPRRKVTDAILAQLGFDVVPKAFVTIWGSGDDKKEVVATDGRKLQVADGTISLVDRGTTTELAAPDRLIAVGFVPHGVAIFGRTGKQLAACDAADGSYQIELSTAPTR